MTDSTNTRDRQQSRSTSDDDQQCRCAHHTSDNELPNHHEHHEVFVISVAAELAGMHAQTLRNYDRMGLVTPQRTRGGGRRYSRGDVEMLRRIQQLSQVDGVNLAGIKEILALSRENERLRRENERLRRDNERLSHEAAHRPRSATRGEIVHVPRSTAIVMWEPRRGRSHTRRSS